MSDKINEQLSALMDDELSSPDHLLQQISEDEALRARWHRYHLIRDIISEHAEVPAVDITARVSQALESEPTIFAPLHKTIRTKRMKFVMKQAAGLAIAATVSAVAVITVQQQKLDEQPATTAIAEAAVPQVRNQVRYVSETKKLDRAVQSKLSNYLVNHNEYSVTSKMQGVLPYMRIVTVTQGERVMVQNANEQ